MTSLIAFITSPRFVDLAIALVLLELCALALYRARRHRGMRTSELVAFLGAGMAMLVAMRVTASGGGSATFIIAMTASLVLQSWHIV
ncbi:MAG: hypothetical protein ABI889_03335, partial [Gemmatimonadota bacterium]